MAVFHDILSAPKAISIFPGWTDAEAETGYVWFDAPLEIEGVTEAGFVFHGGTYIDKPECNVTFELVVRNLRGRRRIPIARVDWRSLRGGHSNPRGYGPRNLAGKRVGPTHFHSLDANWVEEQQRMRAGNLPFAEAIAEQLQSFEDVLLYSGKMFRINNIHLVERPKWRYDLFYDSGRWD
jgi:hypothetical protein